MRFVAAKGTGPGKPPNPDQTRAAGALDRTRADRHEPAPHASPTRWALSGSRRTRPGGHSNAGALLVLSRNTERAREPLRRPIVTRHSPRSDARASRARPLGTRRARAAAAEARPLPVISPDSPSTGGAGPPASGGFRGARGAWRARCRLCPQTGGPEVARARARRARRHAAERGGSWRPPTPFEARVTETRLKPSAQALDDSRHRGARSDAPHWRAARVPGRRAAVGDLEGGSLSRARRAGRVERIRGVRLRAGAPQSEIQLRAGAARASGGPPLGARRRRSGYARADGLTSG